MATDFGLLVGRFNTAAPTISTDNSLRELRIDSGGRLLSRLTDGNDNQLSYFTDGDSVGSGSPDDRGLLILGKNDADSNYQALRVLDDGSLSVSSQGGADASEAADSANANDGEVDLTIGTWVLVQEISITSGKLHINGWSFGSDKNTILQLTTAVDTAADGTDRADVTEILDTHITTSSRPSDHENFSRALTISGAADKSVAIFAKQLQTGNAGVAFSMINANTTT